MDKKEVFVVTNYFDPNVGGEGSSTNKDENRKQAPCPLAIVQCNKYMGGVDLSVQKLNAMSSTENRIETVLDSFCIF